MLDRLSRTLVTLSGRGDLVIAIFVLVAIVMMMVPLPTPLVDVLITSNIAVSVLILLVAFHISEPVEFSSLPAVLLLATLFRLAITITTSRLVLLQADAGEIVNTFGSFVIGGNIAVGLVVFLIISIAQFVVITKGAERVAEVAARFSLDAMPGKQMSIDSDLRNGDIDRIEARGLRHNLARESHLYGAMDGAMKFVKGDAIAGLVVILVNLFGGLAVGIMQRGLSAGEAVETYSLLTVGDGLVGQIPALLISVAAGTVVTRVASAERANLGAEIIGQVWRDPRALALAAAVMLGLSFIPGFPMSTFLALSAAFVVGSYVIHRRTRAFPHGGAGNMRNLALASKQPQELAADGSEKFAPGQHAAVQIGRELAGAIDIADFRVLAQQLRQELSDDLGVEVPPIELRVDETSEPNRFRLDLEGVPVTEGDIPPGRLLVKDDRTHLELLAIRYEEGPELVGRTRGTWVDRRHEMALAKGGVNFLSPLQTLGECLSQTLRRYAPQFVGIQETSRLLATIEPYYGELAKEAQKVAPLQKIAEILRRLVEENVPIRNLRLILEALVEWGQREQDVVLLVEYVRAALCRQICFRCADRNRCIAAYVLERSAEDLVRSSVRPTAVGQFLSAPEHAVRPIIEDIRTALAAAGSEARPVVLASMDVRRHVRNLLMRNGLDLPVLSYQELAPEFSIQPLATVAGEPVADNTGRTAQPQLDQAVLGH
jgi:type III secretion protein V